MCKAMLSPSYTPGVLSGLMAMLVFMTIAFPPLKDESIEVAELEIQLQMTSLSLLTGL